MNETEQELELAKMLYGAWVTDQSGGKSSLKLSGEPERQRQAWIAEARAAIAFLKPAPVAVLTEQNISDMAQAWKNHGALRGWSLDDIKAELMNAAKSVGLLPPEPVETPGRRFAIAWHGSDHGDVSKRLGDEYDAATAKARTLLREMHDSPMLRLDGVEAALADLELKK